MFLFFELDLSVQGRIQEWARPQISKVAKKKIILTRFWDNGIYNTSPENRVSYKYTDCTEYRVWTERNFANARQNGGTLCVLG